MFKVPNYQFHYQNHQHFPFHFQYLLWFYLWHEYLQYLQHLIFTIYILNIEIMFVGGSWVKFFQPEDCCRYIFFSHIFSWTRRFFYLKTFLFSTNPSVNGERSLASICGRSRVPSSYISQPNCLDTTKTKNYMQETTKNMSWICWTNSKGSEFNLIPALKFLKCSVI